VCLALLEPMLYLLYTVDLPVALVALAITVTYMDNTIILMAHNNPIEASLRLQESFFYIQK